MTKGRILGLFSFVLLCFYTASNLEAQDHSLKTHTVRSGDTLYGISRTYGLTIQEIRALNDLRGNTINVGQILVVGSQTASEVIQSEEEVVPLGKFTTHKMGRREPVEEVLEQYQMTMEELLLLNPGIAVDALVTGSVINVLTPPDTLLPDPYAIRKDTASRSSIRVEFYTKEERASVLSSGALYNPASLTMAHYSIPLGHLVRLRNPANQSIIAVLVNDRSNGPNTIKLSDAAAKALGLSETMAEVEILSSIEL